jgi:basic membrane protein A
VFDTIRDVTEGRFEGGLHAFGLAQHGVGYVSDGPHATAISPEIKAKVAELSARIERGEIKVPAK